MTAILAALILAAPITADDAAKHVGETATVEFTIVQVGKSKENTFLNSKAYERGGDNKSFVCFIPGDAKAAFQKKFGDDLKISFQGKKVQVTGLLKDFRGSPEVVLNSPDQLKIIH